ncbi:MAG: flagellar assembly protein FliH [Desulfovibrio sp.]|jgi:flagellar biosynthesis/type III secretory pathway protein FliH|nr:flagellar assembly protein FliH [Desulfovibrio sp.]
MASDELRKKWGTVFMGEREADMAELAAMQEPLRKERQGRQLQRDYLENVRARAAERAREILAAAYAEREKILEDAKREAGEHSLRLERESGALKAAAEAAYARATEEREAAAALRQEAGEIRSAAHSEGFQTGMKQAGAELMEFRAELGASLAALLRAVEAQRRSITAFWREDVAELARAAVTAGTGWTLGSEHENILRALVLNSLDMLEERAILTLRVHPEDVAQVSELFAAARERAPDLKQWAVTADAGMEHGDFTVENAHGSVESRREYFRETVRGVLANLVLPAGEDEVDHAPVDGKDMGELVEREVERITRLMPPPVGAVPAPLSGDAPEMDDVPNLPEPPADSPEQSPAETVSDAMPAESGAGALPELTPGGEAKQTSSEAPAPDAAKAHAGDDAQSGPDADTEADFDVAEKTDPTVKELEDELFSGEAETSPNASADASSVFAEGGFLPGGESHEA